MGETPFHEQNKNASVEILPIFKMSCPQTRDLKQKKCLFVVHKGLFQSIFLFHKLTV